MQFRNWNIAGDVEQLLFRGAISYKPKQADIKFSLGFANITSGSYGTGNTTTTENRVFQEALFPVQFGGRFYTNHRIRYEQRFVENQEFRTRFRYNLFLNIPLNKKTMEAKAIYVALYNEIFINGQRSIGNGNSVEVFDRNRFYIGTGYIIKKGLNIQLGTLNQATDNWQKNQIQLGLHHKI